MLRSVFWIGMLFGTNSAAPEDSGVSQWNDITAWIKTSFPAHLAFLRDGVGVSEISSAEAKLGYRFPQSVVDVLTLNDGETARSQGLFGTWRFLPLQEQLDLVDHSLDDSRFVVGAFHPLLMSGGGDYYGFEPGTERMWEWNHEIGRTEVEWRNFGSFLTDFSGDLKAGEFVRVEGIRGLVARDEL